ncbi:penicillin acylase family protein [Rhodoferax sp. OV413]|uniref:penicillin acylase family protein n=1 Tax=Rhodoferax sp. OV413 TaxID=1855285 RepID=UPI0025E03C36|nr:penicillin acylase family protein [Rhodoferax sp. OV413]
MKLALKLVGALLALLVLIAAGLGGRYLYPKLPERSGQVYLQKLGADVVVRFDERGVPHISARNEMDLYSALGYVHAQDRLFQMEIVRRLAKGELAEVLGPKLLEVDKLFRTMGLRQHAQKMVADFDRKDPANRALLSYLSGINQYQESHPPPLEFDVLGITPRPFTPEDTYAVAGYLAYSFAAAFRQEPVMTFIRDKLGPDYLRNFDLSWHPEGVINPLAQLNDAGWQSLNRIAAVSLQATELGGIPLLEGSNAWAISGRRTESGSPLLAGDPHIAFSAPAIWYEAHLSSPDFELYGHFQALNPTALLGHNQDFGWTLTMFQNDDIDLIAETVNPQNPQQVWHRGAWVNLTSRTEQILVKGAEPVQLTLRSSPNGPIINDAFKDSLGATPISMWWAFLATENPIQQAFFELNRADTLEKARNAASKIHAPGLNVVWANAEGDIGWWAAALLPQRPVGVNPAFILNAAKGEADKKAYYAFRFNPQEENPARGYVFSANHQPQPASGVPVPGYYNLPDRAQRLDARLSEADVRWNSAEARKLQLDVTNGYGPRIMRDLLPVMTAVVTDANETAFMEPLTRWDGAYTPDSIAATMFTQFLYELTRGTFADELGPVQFENLLNTRALDHALPLLAADANSPWWDDVSTPAKENRFEIVRIAWSKTLKHLTGLYGTSLLDWTWGRTHTLTHNHPLGRQKPLNYVFDVGPFSVPGGRETPNNFAYPLGPAPWAVTFGPSTRRVIDFADAAQAVGINPLGQSGVWPDWHYSDQARAYVAGEYLPMWLDSKDVLAHTRSTLTLRPAR